MLLDKVNGQDPQQYPAPYPNKYAGVDSVKTKTIRDILNKKHKQFVSSIEDAYVRNLVDKNSIITGGCIVSMLLNEPVNDFDYYFTDKETCSKVANYFVKKFNGKTGSDVKVLDEEGRIKIYIASEGIASDLPESNGAEDDMESTTIIDDPNEFRAVFLSSNAISLTNKVQLVIRFYGNPEEIHSSYDFVHATCYWTSSDNHLVLPQKALESIITKDLVYTGSKYPLCSIIRTKKFIGRGWRINAGQYVKMALQLNELDLLDASVLEEQLTGVDSAYFNQVISYIKQRKESDPSFTIDSSYLIAVIDRIFQ